ncbi:RNA polymerase sigma-70 factor (ECF subfamily) [Friedmanniella endophytica]|uniref:RNA polymerase sigma-70 factor (ECF subfamily) n=1 Tax=Microlunatus kandeliicorticis TaxID=1759536 RepID=A0A7W3ISK5_9ACTN|nr:RNA polymerase sigma factor SigE [Microlunatus kandeliicorticis]MBA8794484.1 RNA polymerase sigma-70 factor (ECF subfamily) [Microlunatus kandeliicorticis]
MSPFRTSAPADPALRSVLTVPADPAVAEWTPPSWEDVVRDHSARVYRLAYRLTGNSHDAEDLTQDVFVRVFRSLHKFQPGTFEGWLHRITTNLFLDGARRRQKIRFDALADGADDRLPSHGPTPGDQLADADLDHDVAAALSALSPEFRAAVVLCDIEGLSYEEIADVLDVKIGTVRSRIHRGRSQLRTALAHRRPTDEHARYFGVEAETGAETDRSSDQTDLAAGGRRSKLRVAPA